MNDTPEQSEITYETVTVRTSDFQEKLQDELDAMSDSEREQALQELRVIESTVAQSLFIQTTRQIDAMIMGSLGFPASLPPDPSHYTHDSNATIIDVD